MNKEELGNIIVYNNYAITMSEIALGLLLQKDILKSKGVPELLALYMLIPYITNQQLDTPDSSYHIPKLDVNSVFTKVLNPDGNLSDMTLDGLRNAICHSFVALTTNGDLMIDDRASCDRKTHDSMTDKGFCNRLKLDKTREKLISLHKEIVDSQKKYNCMLYQEFIGDKPCV